MVVGRIAETENARVAEAEGMAALGISESLPLALMDLKTAIGNASAQLRTQ